MKKSIVVIVLALAALALFATGVAFAQTPQPPRPFNSEGGRGTGEGPLHDYMVNAMATALGITPAELEAQRAAGKTAYQVALDLRISADKIPVLLSGARVQAVDAALTAGAITQQQADWMKTRGASTGIGMGGCGDAGGQPGGGMGRGWRWQQTNP